MDTFSIDVGGLPVYTRALGAGGPPVVLLHGFVVSGRYLLPLARRLAGRFRVFVPDLPGFGRSGHPARPPDLAALADAVAAWMSALGLERAAFFGNSMGCQVAALLAVRHPRRVTRLVLQGPTVDRRARSVLRQAFRLALDFVREPVSFLPVVVLDALRAGPRMALGLLPEVLSDRIEARLPAVAAPVLVVVGTRDTLVPRRWAAEVAAAAPLGRLVVVPGAPHAMNYATPDLLAHLVTPFLDADAVTASTARSPRRPPPSR